MAAMRIATWNVNSIRARLDRIAAWTEREMPDVLCFQEIKCTEDLFPREPFEALGYHLELYGQPTYNGVAILSREPAKDVVRGLPDDEPDAQRRLLAATVGGVRIVTVYVPNGQSPESEKFVFKMAWLARLRDYLEGEIRPRKPFVILGDFNIAPEERDVRYIEEWRGKIHFHPKEHAALARIAELGLGDLFRKHHEEGGHFSWWDYRRLAFQKNNGLRIDLILGNKPAFNHCTACEMFRDERKGETPSDHIPVVATLDV
jgi:exodeoxyribonuclease-3